MQQQLIHATAVEVAGAGVLITGASGIGKSSFALQILGLGGRLIADDQVLLKETTGEIWASKPNNLPSLIEARGVGLLTVPMAPSAKLHLIIDLDTEEEVRLPAKADQEILGQKITVWRKSVATHFPSAVLLYLTNISKNLSPETPNDF